LFPEQNNLFTAFPGDVPGLGGGGFELRLGFAKLHGFGNLREFLRDHIVAAKLVLPFGEPVHHFGKQVHLFGKPVSLFGKPVLVLG
jgi:hypothetical protein